jgi:hypothetical protein
MHVEYDILQAAGQLITGAISNGLPTEDQAEFSGLGEREQKILEDLLDELAPHDLAAALKLAAERMNESDYEDGDGDEDA